MIKEIFTSIVIDNLTVNLRHLELENQRSNSTPIVILPGFGGIAEGFRDNMKSLFEAGYWPLVVDNLGFGGSDKPKDFNYSIKNLVRIIYRWIKKMELDQFIIVGTSLGGGIALGIREIFNSSVKAVILVAPAGFGRYVLPLYRLGSQPVIREFFVWVLFNRWVPINQGRNSWKRVVADISKLPDHFIKSSDLLKQSKGLRYAYSYILRHYITLKGQSDRLNQRIHKMCYELRKSNTPVLIVWGKNDKVIPIRHASSVIKHTNGQLKLVKKVGHMPYLERPLEFNSIIRSFLLNLEEA